VVVVLGAGAVMVAEPDLGDFGDALWWAIVTSTTVGYGDLAPVSIVGRLVAVVLMIVGIGALGMITGSIATHFLHGKQERTNPHLEHLKAMLDAWDDLTREERLTASALLRDLAHRSSDADRRHDP
jgi:voltage-gated potassium channel